jgi:hypothetical protein
LVRLTKYILAFDLLIYYCQDDNVDFLAVDPNTIRLMVIGDSLSYGYTDGSKKITHSCLHAFPALTACGPLHRDVALNLVAFPGITLVSPTVDESGEGMPLGTVEKMSHGRSRYTILLHSWSFVQSPSDSDNTMDGLHPNRLGHKVLAKELKKHLVKIVTGHDSRCHKVVELPSNTIVGWCVGTSFWPARKIAYSV